jgi:hypothetical protein
MRRLIGYHAPSLERTTAERRRNFCTTGTVLTAQHLVDDRLTGVDRQAEFIAAIRPLADFPFEA